MMQSNRLPLLRRMRIKSIVKHDLKEPKKGSMVIMNTTNSADYLNKFGPIQIQYNNLFQQIYTDRKVRDKFGNQVVNKNLKTEMDLFYSEISSQVPKFKGVLEGRLSLGFNLIYDLGVFNNIFLTSTNNIAPTKKHGMYWDLASKFISNSKFEKYKYKTMVIPASDYVGTISEDIMGTGTKNFNPLAYLYKMIKYDIDTFLLLGDIDIIITMGTDSLRINPKECAALLRQDRKKNIASMFRKELFKLMNKRDVEEEAEKSDAERILTGNDSGSISSTLIARYANGMTQEIPEDVQEKIIKAVDKVVTEKDKSGVSVTPAEVEKEIESNIELIKDIAKDRTNKSAKQSASNKRDELLREKQKELSLRGKNIKEILETKSEEIPIESNDISNKVDTLNKNVTNVRFPNINKTYVEKLMDKDILGSIMSLNDKSIPVYVRSIKVEDSSDLSNYKETYYVELEDSLRVRHKLTFDVPKVIDGRFLYLGGNRKYINNQQMMLPIVKTAPDTVQLVSNYNKIFIRRYGDKVSSVNEKLKKALGVPNCGARVIPGKFDTENKGFVTTIDYDDLSKLYKEINVGDVKIVFSQSIIREELSNANIKGVESKLDKELLPIGISNGGRAQFYFIDLSSNEVVKMDLNGKTENTKQTLIEFILSKSPELEKTVGAQTAGKKYMYTRATIMTRQVPIILLLAYFEGMDGILKRANVKHHFTDTRPRVDSDEGVIEFADGYLVYSKKPFEIGMLMNGLLDVPTKNYNYQDFNEKFQYQPIFETMFGRRNIANAFDNFLDNFVDSATLDVLKRLNLPTDLVGMMLHANALLADNQHNNEVDARMYRIRSAEVINSIIYKNIMKAYEKYKETAHYSNPKKISIKRDAIVKDVMMQQIVEDYSELNPISECQKLHGCTKKGPSGCNLAQAYTEEQRSFHHSMTGLFTISSSPDGNVGVQRVLTMEPPITDPRGFIDNKALDGRLDEYTDANLFGVAEMLTTFGVQRDDGIRTAMSTKQSGHITGIKNSSPSLVTNGAEQALPYHVSKDWAFVAEEDGEVMELDSKTGLMIVKYASGKTEAVTVGTRIARNGAGGFNLSKSMTANFKKGDKFEKNDILAQDKEFFSKNDLFGTKFNIGSLQKVALLSSAMTFEDSSYISKKVSRDMASEIVMQKQAVVGPNTNIDYMVKVGDRVESGDELLRFERSFDEDALNTLLFNVGEDMKEEIAMSGKDKIKSKYTGVIEDIKIYCTVELDELSPSLRKIVSTYYSQIKDKERLLNKYDKSGNKVLKCGMLFNEPTGKVETNNGKLRGAIVNDGVLIEFYIKVHDELGVGDKLVFFSALKSIVGTVIEEGQEAYTLSRPEEKIGAVLSCNSLISRGVTSCPLMMSANKLLIEFSRQLREVYES